MTASGLIAYGTRPWQSEPATATIRRLRASVSRSHAVLHPEELEAEVAGSLTSELPTGHDEEVGLGTSRETSLEFLTVDRRARGIGGIGERPVGVVRRQDDEVQMRLARLLHRLL